MKWRAASVSRQGLYVHFATKDDLFRATVYYALESSFAAAEARLAAERSSYSLDSMSVVSQALCLALGEAK